MENIKCLCPICNSPKIKELFKAKDRFKISDRDFRIRKCSNCEIVFTSPAINWTDMKKFYAGHYFWKKEYGAKNKLVKLIRKVEDKYHQYALAYETKRLLKFIGKKGKILDVGCGTGLRLEAFKKRGFNQFCGIEPLKNEASYAKEIRKLPVEQKTLAEFNCPENSFDIITLYNVLEHLDKPFYHLKIIGKILKPKGWLVIQIPNFNSWQARLFKDKWMALDIPSHYFHYTPKTINNILSQNGFKVEVIDWKANFLRPMFWSFSFSNFSPHLLWEKEEKGEITICRRIFWILLTMLSIIPAQIENLFYNGGQMTIYAINQK